MLFRSALPDVWSEGSVKGLRCRGGFTLEEMNWENNQLKSVEILSNLGGSMRLRSAIPLYMDGKKLSPVKSDRENENPLLQAQEIRKPLISPQAPINTTNPPSTYIYDIETKAGVRYSLAGE